MDQAYPHLHIVLLADDYGEELWPLAREQAPACLAQGLSGDATSLLAAAAHRVLPFTDEPLHVVTTSDLSAPVYAELVGQDGVEAGDIDMIELPLRHGSAFAVALACACIRRDDPDAVIMVVPANQHVELDERWGNLVYRAYQVALRDQVVLFGSQQERRAADTSYIRTGKQYENVDSSYCVRSFSLCASLSSAKRAVSGGALWYTGIFIARAARVLGMLAASGDAVIDVKAPGQIFGVDRIAETAGFLAVLDRGAWTTPEARSLIAALPQASIERAAMSDPELLVAVALTSSVSRFAELSDLDVASDPDASGNRCFGPALAVESSDVTLVEQEEGRILCTLGLEDVAVIDTVDAVLVASKRSLRSMGSVRDALRNAGAEQLLQSARRSFVWGSARLVSSTAASAVFELDLNAGARLEPLGIPFEYGCFAGHKKTAKLMMRAQCCVACGNVVLEDAREGVQLEVKDAGSAFAVSAEELVAVLCVEEGPARLVMTVTIPC